MSRTPDPRVEFLLDFIERALPLRPSSWARLRDELSEFCLGGTQRVDRGALVGQLIGPEPTEADIRNLRDDVQKLVAGFVDADTARMATKSAGDARATVPVEIGLTLLRATGTNRLLLLLTSPRLRDLVLTIGAIVLGREPFAQIERCADPGCGRMFVKVGKKRFCSPTHAMRVLMRAKRAAAKGARAPTRHATLAKEQGAEKSSKRRSSRRRAKKPPRRKR